MTAERPRRVQLKRAKGWRMPENTVKVDRSTKWGNPFVPGDSHPLVPGRVADKRHAARLFAAHAPLNAHLVATARAELRGKNLACWCNLDEECHADVLLTLANSGEDDDTRN